MTEPVPYTQASMLSKIVNSVNENLKYNLDWLDLAYPVVKTVEREIEGRSFRFPGVYQNDGSNYHIAISPDNRTRSFCFYEINGQFDLTDTDPFAITGSINYDIALICWLNLPKIYGGRSDDFTEELILDLFQNGGMKKNTGIIDIEDISLELRIDQIFSRYDYDQTDKQFLIYPYSAFKINMNWLSDLKLC